MSARVWVAYGVLAALVLALVAGGVYIAGYMFERYTYDIGNLRTETASIDRGEAETVRAEIIMGVGQLTVQGGAVSLLDGTFVYNVADLQPIVSFTVTDTHGVLSVHPDLVDMRRLPNPNRTSEYQNDWILRLTEQVPLTLEIVLGVGEANLYMNGMQLDLLSFEMGVGEAVVDLTGDWSHSFSVSLEGGTGQTHVVLPANVGVRVQAEEGIGETHVAGLTRQDDHFVNEAYGLTDVVIDVTAETGVGEILLQVEGFPLEEEEGDVSAE